MRPMQHPSNNCVLEAPQGWDQKSTECSSLPVTVTEVNGLPCVFSYWTLEEKDIELIKAGGSIALVIVGRSMPPVSIGVTPTPQQANTH